MHTYIYNTDELYHHGTKGMRWGHRKKQPTSSVTVRKSSKKSTPSNSIKTRKQLKARQARGKTYVKTFNTKKVKAVIASTASVASGTLWVASVFLPGPGALVANGAAAVSNMISVSINN